MLKWRYIGIEGETYEEDSKSELEELTAGDELAGATEDIEEVDGRVEEAEVSGATEDEAVLDGATS